MYGGVRLVDDLEQFRKQVQQMSDDELIRQGKACRSLCSPESNFGRPPRDVWVQQLKVLREEYRRRHPKT